MVLYLHTCTCISIYLHKCSPLRDFESVYFLLLSQVSSGAAVSNSMPAGHVPNRSVQRPIHVTGMQRMPHQAMQAYNLTSQAGMGGGMNPGGIPMQRGVPQPHQQQQVWCLLGFFFF